MTPSDVMNAQPHAETTSCHLLTTADSDDSDEESSQEEPPATSWNDLSIIERVGLNSVEMSETDVETAFSQITLAFRCDQYTLKQRLQAEEHARNLAEENIQLELSRGRETLEMLKGLCLDSKRSKILQRLELSMDILAGTVERISNTAEVLGAVHQEARVSRAVELMVAHMENLRRRHDRHEAELEEAKKMIQQQNPSRSITDPSASPEPDESENRKRSSYQNSSRRRVSISLIPNQVQALQEKGKRDMKKKAAHGEKSSKTSMPTCPSPCMSSESSCSALTKDDNYSVDDRPPDLEPPSEAAGSGALVPPDPSPVPNPDRQCPPPKEGTTRKTPLKSSPIATVRQRHKGKVAFSKKRDKDKKRTNIYPQTTVGIYGSLWRQRPLAHWLYGCRWPLLCLYVVVLLSVLTLICFL